MPQTPLTQAEQLKAAYIAAGWTQRDFALNLCGLLGEQPIIRAAVGDATLVGPVMEIKAPHGQRPIYVIYTDRGLLHVPADQVLPRDDNRRTALRRLLTSDLFCYTCVCLALQALDDDKPTATAIAILKVDADKLREHSQALYDLLQT